jgi:hypothetical protein
MAANPEFRYLLTSVYQSGSTPNPVIAELPFTNVNFTQQLNSIGTFQGEILLSGINSSSMNVYNGTIPGKVILWVLYADPTSLVFSPIWSGIVWNREYDSATQRLSITAQEMISLYQRRRVTATKTYVAQDPAYIARNLLQFTEGVSYGKTGLTYDSTTTGLSTSRTYNAYEYKPVYQAIKDLASSFFDFKIKPYNSSGNLVNQFEIGYPLGTAYSASSTYAPIFQFPGNVISYRFPEDGQSAANQLYGLGYGANNTKLIASAVDTNKYAESPPWPLLQDTANYTDIADINLLKNVTLGQLNATSYPPTTIEVVIPIYIDPVYPLYQIGDYVRFDIKDDYFPSGISFGSNSDALRIVAISINPGENGPSNVTLTLTRQLAAGSVS